MKGLLGKREISETEALFFPKCNSIHTFFMSFPIDAVFLKNGAVVRIIDSLTPGKIICCHEADSVLEIKTGESRRKNIKQGDVLVFRSDDDKEGLLL